MAYDYVSAIGQAIGQAPGQYYDQMDHIHKQIQEQYDRDQKTSVMRLNEHRGAAQAAIGQGDYAGAHQENQAGLPSYNTLMGTNNVGDRLIGTRGTHEAPRPIPNFQGPMPGVSTYDPSTPDYANPQNRTKIERMAQYAPPKPIELTGGSSLVQRQPGGGYGVAVTAPYPAGDYKLTAEQQMEKQRLHDESVGGIKIQIAGMPSRGRGGAGRANPRTRYVWATDENGDRVRVEDGAGVVSHAPPVKPKTRAQIDKEVDGELKGEAPDKFASPAEKTAFNARRNRMVRQRVRQTQAPTPKPMPKTALKADADFDAWLNKSLPPPKGGKSQPAQKGK